MGSTDKLRKASKARAPAKLRGAPDSQLKVMGSTGTLRKASKARARPKLREVPESQLEATESTNKLMEASMALLQGAPDSQLNIVVLNKALFYLDLIALRDFGRTITGERYVALPQGPMVADYARKIVHGEEQEMGVLGCHLVRPSGQLTCTIPQGVWHFLVRSDSLTGELRLLDDTRFREVRTKRAP